MHSIATRDVIHLNHVNEIQMNNWPEIGKSCHSPIRNNWRTLLTTSYCLTVRGSFSGESQCSTVLRGRLQFLSLCPAVCLPTWDVPSTSAPLDSSNMSYFQTWFSSLPSFLFFHSSPYLVSLLGSLYLGQGCTVNGVLSRLWTDSTSTIDILPTPFGMSISIVTFSHPLRHFSAWLASHLWISMAG